MIRFLVIFLLLSGCDPGPALKCDYCHVSREGTKRYVCDKCQMPHSACDVDRAVMHYSESGSFRGRTSYSATSVLVCPSPEDPAKEPHAEIVASREEPLYIGELWRRAPIAFMIMQLGAIALGYLIAGVLTARRFRKLKD